MIFLMLTFCFYTFSTCSGMEFDGSSSTTLHIYNYNNNYDYGYNLRQYAPRATLHIHDSNMISWDFDKTFEILENLRSLTFENCIFPPEVNFNISKENYNLLTSLSLPSNGIDNLDFLINSNIVNNIKNLSLQNNNITILKTFNFPNLELLNLSENFINKIPNDFLVNSTLIRELYINKNSISKLDELDFLKNFQYLQILDLHKNYIFEIKIDTFKNLKLLNELKLQENRIESIENGSFSNLKELKILLLSSNYLDSVNDGNWFDDDSKLMFLDLKLNRLKKITKNDFNKLKKLSYLNLGDNLISVIDELSFVNNNELEELILSNNTFKIIEENMLVPLKVIKFLDVSKNLNLKFNLENIELLHLETLNLSRTNISTESIKFEMMKNIEELNLSGNNYTNIDLNSLNDLKHLQVLFLNDNHLKTLDYRHVSISKRGFQINITNNYWECTFLKKMQDYFKSLSMTSLSYDDISYRERESFRHQYYYGHQEEYEETDKKIDGIRCFNETITTTTDTTTMTSTTTTTTERYDLNPEFGYENEMYTNDRHDNVWGYRRETSTEEKSIEKDLFLNGEENNYIIMSNNMTVSFIIVSTIILITIFAIGFIIKNKKCNSIKDKKLPLNISIFKK